MALSLALISLRFVRLHKHFKYPSSNRADNPRS